MVHGNVYSAVRDKDKRDRGKQERSQKKQKREKLEILRHMEAGKVTKIRKKGKGQKKPERETSREGNKRKRASMKKEMRGQGTWLKRSV